MKIYYFGCWSHGYLGHHMRSANGESAPIVGTTPWGREMDGALCPDKRQQTEGAAALHHKAGWTALAFWDRSVDRRYGSNSVFLAEGTFTADEMISIAQERFPRIWKRFRFGVRVVAPSAGQQ